ncbi:hypothetical protein [Chlamydia sp. 17-3921]|uniref:hypothetical protein n=1 Tax=Chlamydia sp. 17-3921 TaxID=2675798 RepID=UPI0019199C25|nr:hypothetical protein [Chlamydia sp. 17-3921]
MSICSLELRAVSNLNLSKPSCLSLKKENLYVVILLLAGLSFLAGCISTILTKEILFGILCVLGGILFSIALLVREHYSSKKHLLKELS